MPRRKRYVKRRKRRNPGRKRYNRGRKSARRSKFKGVPKAVKNMLDVTVASVYLYNWANLSTAEANAVSRLHIWCVWNDAPDIAICHNRLYSSFSPAPLGPINNFAAGQFRGSYQIKNMSNIDVRFDIYKCMAREDMGVDLCPLIAWNSSVQFPDVWPLIVQGWLEQTTAAGSPQTLTNRFLPLGVSLYDINKFCSYFKILKCKRNVRLIGGGEFCFRVKDNWKTWDGTKVYGATGGQNNVDVMFGKRTKFIMAIGTASGVVDAVNDAVTTGIYRLATVGRERYLYTGVPNSTKKSYPVVNDMQTTLGTLSTIDLQTEQQAGYVIAGY